MTFDYNHSGWPTENVLVVIGRGIERDVVDTLGQILSLKNKEMEAEICQSSHRNTHNPAGDGHTLRETQCRHCARGSRPFGSVELNRAYQGLKLVGRAVTVFATPGDNVMIHVAMEQCEPGDVMVVAVNSRSDCGYFGDLLATLMQARRIAGLVIDSGVRDLADRGR